MKDDIRDALIADLQKAAISCRGHVLQRCVELEMLIDIYIGKHFTKDNTLLEELVTLIIAPRVTFDNKLQVLKVLIDKYDSDFKSKKPRFSKELKEIIENRNIFAHYPVDLSNSSLLLYKESRSITLLKFKNMKDEETNTVKLLNRIKYTDKQITALVDSIYDYIDILTDKI